MSGPLHGVKVVELGVKDAFVSAYYNSKRIAFPEGQKLQLENSNLKLEVENPIIFNGTDNGKSTTPTSVTANNNQPVSSIPSATAFTNGVSVEPTPTAENGVKLDDAGISYKVQIGAYKNQVPNDVANKFLNIKTWPVKNVVINNLYIYTIGGFNAFVFAKKLKDEAVSVGITDAFITVYKDGKKVEWAKKVKVAIEKNHINGITTRGRIIMTPHGFIEDTDKDLKKYKDDHTKEWSKILGGGDFKVIEEQDSVETTSTYEQEPE